MANQDLADQDTCAPTFLVVDDEPDILDAIKRLFRRDYTVLTAQSHDEALAIVDREEVEVVLADQRLPASSGIELLAELRRRRPAIVRVLFTGYSNIDDVIDAINEGHVYRYIAKPWNPGELKLFVAQAFEHYRHQRERELLTEQLREANHQLAEHNALLQRANDELTRLDRAKNAFMEVVSHELNTPISVIVGYSFLLSNQIERGHDPLVDKSLSRIDASVGRLKGIANRMFQMLNSTTETLHLEEVDLRDFVVHLHEQVEVFLDKRNQTLSSIIEGGLEIVTVDRDKLNDICLNLIINAIKFSPDGHRVSLRFALAQDPDWVELTVLDRGIGIPADELPMVFDPFFASFDSNHHSSGEFEFGKRGIGLGLAIVKRFAEMHSGRVAVESTPGVGTTFCVTLPRRTPAHLSETLSLRSDSSR